MDVVATDYAHTATYDTALRQRCKQTLNFARLALELARFKRTELKF